MRHLEVGTVKKNAAFSKNIRFKKINWDLMFLFLPGFLLLFVFKYVPIVGITIAFKDFTMAGGIFKSPWAGLENFGRLLSNRDFLLVLKNTVVISLLKIAAAFPAPIIFAMLLNEIVSSKFKKIIQTFSYLPYFFSWVILSGIVQLVFSTHGVVNSVLAQLNFINRPIEFYANGTLFILLLVITHVWQTFGWNSVLYIASITGIDDSLFEAACIDGAGRFKRIIYIILPSLAPTIITVFLLNLGSIMNAGFDQIYNMYNPVVYNVSDILDTYVLRRMRSMDYSLATAAGLFKSIISLALVVSANKVVRRLSDNEMGIW